MRWAFPIQFLWPVFLTSFDILATKTITPTTQLDFRRFMHCLTTMNKEAVEVRLGLLFNVWDTDSSGTLSHSELVEHFTYAVPAHKVQGAVETFQRVWAQIRAFNAREIEKEKAKKPTADS